MSLNVVAWETYLQYGDVTLLREHYPAMVAYIDYLDRTIDPRTGLSTDIELGDWLGPQDDQLGSAFPSGRAGLRSTATRLV